MVRKSSQDGPLQTIIHVHIFLYVEMGLSFAKLNLLLPCRGRLGGGYFNVQKIHNPTPYIIATFACAPINATTTMSAITLCPACQSDLTYENEGMMACSQCFHEWDPAAAPVPDAADAPIKVLDSNGNELHDGDSIIVIKDLPVKGMLRPVKAGTKVKNIRLTDGDHNIDCRIEGFGSMGLKSEFVRKA
jgi:protein PhnA